MKLDLKKAIVLLSVVAVSPSFADVLAKPANSEVPTIGAASNAKSYVIGQGTVFKIKLASEVTSATYRTGDSIEFKVAEDVYAETSNGSGEYAKIIAKDTPVFGKVKQAKRRKFPLRDGSLHIVIPGLPTLNGSLIPVTLYRTVPKPVKSDTAPTAEEAKQQKNVQEKAADEKANGVEGRHNTSYTPVVAAVAGAASVYLKDRTARNIALLTLFSTSGVGDLLYGTEAKFSNTELFDLEVAQSIKANYVEVDKKPVLFSFEELK